MADSDSRAGKRYDDAGTRTYVDRIHATHDAALDKAFDAPGSADMPAIQVAQSEGKMLELLCRLANARKAVEVGTLAGYSTIRLARGLMDGGHLWSLEISEKHAAVARENISAAGLDDRVTVRVGDARQTLSALAGEGPFDLVFLDADKESYVDYGRWAATHLRAGGVLIADNAYYFGNLLEDDDDAARVRAFHEECARAFHSVCVPTPDGIVVGIKK